MLKTTPGLFNTGLFGRKGAGRVTTRDQTIQILHRPAVGGEFVDVPGVDFQDADLTGLSVALLALPGATI